MAISDVLEYIGDDLKKVSAVMESTLQSDIELLNKANDSILSNNGKMLRPMITILSALSCSGTKNEDTISYAAATELLHNATLLHDDVVDDSCLRRGKPTIVSLMGAGPSVLLGDYWLVKAVELVLGRNHAMEVTKIFSKTLSDLASGEMLQMQCSTECNTTEEDYYRIIYSKTASLFETAGTVGAISVNASPEQKETIRGFSYNLGMAFQIKDDILDYEGSAVGLSYEINKARDKRTPLSDSSYCSNLAAALYTAAAEYLAQAGTFRRRGCRGFTGPMYLHHSE